ncbi:MAG: hypothetical protein JST11_17065 [Acidobacteria bacterium]|nr:hypothetical protein [Acidobacteriota bacterium]
MIDRETAEEFANLYDQLQYNLEYLKRFFTAIDATVRTMLQFQELAEPFQRNLHDGQLLPNTREVIEQVDLTLVATRAKAADFRAIAASQSGPVN